jgi:hypothetical protein
MRFFVCGKIEHGKLKLDALICELGGTVIPCFKTASTYTNCYKLRHVYWVMQNEQIKKAHDLTLNFKNGAASVAPINGQVNYAASLGGSWTYIRAEFIYQCAIQEKLVKPDIYVITPSPKALEINTAAGAVSALSRQSQQLRELNRKIRTFKKSGKISKSINERRVIHKLNDRGGWKLFLTEFIAKHPNSTRVCKRAAVNDWHSNWRKRQSFRRKFEKLQVSYQSNPSCTPYLI